MRQPVPRQHLGFIGLLRAVDLLDLFGTALDGGFAMFGSDLVRIDQLLRGRRLTQQKGSCNNRPLNNDFKRNLLQSLSPSLNPAVTGVRMEAGSGRVMPARMANVMN